MEGRIFAIGDIHGCLDHLNRLLNKISLDASKDRLVFIGDYIDRGPHSFGVVERILEIRRVWPQTICLMGNHESMFLDYLEGRDSQNFLFNGGKATLAEYRRMGGGNKKDTLWLPPPHWRFLGDLMLYWETPDYLFVHAGLRPGISLSRQSPDDLIWIRDEFFLSGYDFGKTVVFGHTPFREPFVREGRIGIDTGAVYGNVLTCVVLPEMRFLTA